MDYLAVILGGAIGSVTRYSVSRWIAASVDSEFPWGTLLVNVSGALIIGFLAGLFEIKLARPEWRAFLITGVLGGYTTFSSFGLEAFGLFKSGQLAAGLAYIAASLVLGLTAVALGYLGGLALGKSLISSTP